MERGWGDSVHGHGRKFMRHKGQWIDAEATLHSGPMSFWGEWEAPSHCSPSGASGEGMPRWVHTPYLVDPRTVEDPQNTDPFVFGGFAYTNCRQDYWSKGRNARLLTGMAKLAVGSMILFGSSRKGQFVLDTCFVVGSIVELDPVSYEERARAAGVPEALLIATLAPVLGDDSHQLLSLYTGTTHAQQNEGPFSFFPCRPADVGPAPFPRPRLVPDGPLTGVINGKSAQTFKKTAGDAAFIAHAWQAVVAQVRGAGCCLGVAAEAVTLT
jgi:hypothetical protein